MLSTSFLSLLKIEKEAFYNQCFVKGRKDRNGRKETKEKKDDDSPSTLCGLCSIHCHPGRRKKEGEKGKKEGEKGKKEGEKGK